MGERNSWNKNVFAVNKSKVTESTNYSNGDEAISNVNDDDTAIFHQSQINGKVSYESIYGIHFDFQ